MKECKTCKHDFYYNCSRAVKKNPYTGVESGYLSKDANNNGNCKFHKRRRWWERRK